MPRSDAEVLAGLMAGLKTYRSRGTQTRRQPGGPRRVVNGGNATQTNARFKVKTRTGSKTKYKKKSKAVFRETPGSELRQTSVKGGKTQKRNLAGAWKMINANTQSNTYGISLVNRFMSYQNSNADGTYLPTGACYLGMSWTGANPGLGAVTMPLVLWNLSATPNIYNGAISYPNLSSVLQRNSVNGEFSFNSGSQSKIYHAGGRDSLAVPNSTDILKSFAAKMVLYGTLTRPVKYQIDLVQFMEPYLHPEFLSKQGAGSSGANGNTGTLPDQDRTSAIEAFDELTRTFTFSPATFHNGNALKNKMKVLKSWTHLIQPRLSNEQANAVEVTSGTTTQKNVTFVPHSHIFNIYHLLNRRSRYDWSELNTSAEPIADGAVDIPTINIGINKTDVTYKARVYLMIRALATEPTVNGLWNTELTPSYDISLKTYHQNFD